VRARERRAFHPGIDPTAIDIETTYEGALWVDGVLRHASSTNRNLKTGAWLGTTEVRSVEHNIELAEGFFSGRL